MFQMNRMKRPPYNKTEKWIALEREGIEEVKKVIISGIIRLSEPPLGISSARWDQQRPDWLPSNQSVRKILNKKTWSGVLAIAGLKPSPQGPKLGSKRRRPNNGESIVAKIRSECLPDDYAIRRLVVKCSDIPEPCRYWDTTKHQWIETVKYRNGHFGPSDME